MGVSEEVEEIINRTVVLAKSAHFEYVVPELMLFVICQNVVFAQAFENCGGSVSELDYHLRTYLEEQMECWEADEEEGKGKAPGLSLDMQNVLEKVGELAENSGKEAVELPHVLFAIYGLEESYAAYYMLAQGVERNELLQEMAALYEEGSPGDNREPGAHHREENHGMGAGQEEPEDDEDWEGDERPRSGRQGAGWQRYVVCLNDLAEQANPLIGREEELERTMQILCRREKNNPLHIGEPGVGKTAIAYGLARLLEEGRVPEPLRGAKIYALDLGSLLAGTQYRGDFEKRFKKVMDGVSRQEKPILYMDEIHNIVGAGAVGGGAFDVSNMLKPYLERGQIRFIGATTYGEYKKYFEKSKGLVRRFQNVEIREPAPGDCVRILEGLKEGYERFHGVTYEEGALEYAVEMSAKHINERFLPDKAVDLMDEAGAYRRLHPLAGERQSVGKDLIDELLSRVCHIPRQAVERDEAAVLATLERRLQDQIFGQEEAVSQVVNAVKFSKAGLLEEGKPLASLLFVGPTGVGKTEIAKSLARELGISLVRFDMSEYGEKHAVAKLVGAPAGYVGYEEGGLLTEEIRKHPHAVLLLDEIEKAHPDIYNILLQVMDYATLTDNQGRKADFRNIILIMTSNAGASRVGKPGIGFGGAQVKSDAILEEVKRIFQPEFRNRLTRTVVFNGMDDKMAGLIVDKKLGELKQMLLRRNIELWADEKARAGIKRKGTSAEFGAREIERVIQGEIKPLLVDEILFGALKEGGKCFLSCEDGTFTIRRHKAPAPGPGRNTQDQM
ncbi:MAG: AAA domain-containing protein [Lachnospiraceae bacterium]|nr:AAA domain-containing protein [Lachnospiraceae bacterium]